MVRRSNELAIALLLGSACTHDAGRPEAAWNGPAPAADETGPLDEVDPIDETGDDETGVGETGEIPTAEAGARPNFQLPVPCGQVWTTSTHSGHSSIYKLDLINTGGATRGTPALASAAGRVVTAAWFNDAGNMVVVDHGGGWQTRYLHLDSMSVGVGAQVQQGQELGKIGNTGASTGPHLHYEQKADGAVVQVSINGRLVPVKWGYNQHFETSANCGNGPNEPYGKIGEKWHAMGAANSPVGKPIRPEYDALFGGRFQDFEHGMIIWHPQRAPNAWAVYGQIFEVFRATGSEESWGFPTMDELDAAAGPDGTRGRYQYFEDALFLWSHPAGAHPVVGEIHDAFVDAGREQALGYPLGPQEAEGDDGLVQAFENANIHWNPDDGAWITDP